MKLKNGPKIQRKSETRKLGEHIIKPDAGLCLLSRYQTGFLTVSKIFFKASKNNYDTNPWPKSLPIFAHHSILLKKRKEMKTEKAIFAAGCF
ncbi:MAG: hypothetical protein Q4D36_06905, partial [Bacteroidales bacterium]|nr:hypothetical protein [Bacteroidales bacterium]